MWNCHPKKLSQLNNSSLWVKFFHWFFDQSFPMDRISAEGNRLEFIHLFCRKCNLSTRLFGNWLFAAYMAVYSSVYTSFLCMNCLILILTFFLASSLLKLIIMIPTSIFCHLLRYISKSFSPIGTNVKCKTIGVVLLNKLDSHLAKFVWYNWFKQNVFNSFLMHIS